MSQIMIDGRTGEGLDEVLTHADPKARVFGRCMANGFSATLADWAQDECNRGTDVTEILFSATSIFAQTIGSVLAATLRPGADEAVAVLLAQRIQKIIPEHTARVRAMQQDGGRA